VTTKDFMSVWADTELRQYIVDQSKRRSKRIELQEEYTQEAWLCISCAPGGLTCEAYKDIAHMAIYSSYWQNHKENMLSRNTGPSMSYARNPFDHNEMLIGGKTPGRPMSDNMNPQPKRDWRN